MESKRGLVAVRFMYGHLPIPIVGVQSRENRGLPQGVDVTVHPERKVRIAYGEGV